MLCTPRKTPLHRYAGVLYDEAGHYQLIHLSVALLTRLSNEVDAAAGQNPVTKVCF